MNIQWVLMAEGITQDARGAVTAVGVCQTVLVAPTLPVQAKRAIVALITGENEEFVAGRQFSYSVSVADPSGRTLSALSGLGAIGPVPYPELPFGLNVASESVFTVIEYGRHVITLVVQAGDDPELTAEVNFYAAKPPAVEVASKTPVVEKVLG